MDRYILSTRAKEIKGNKNLATKNTRERLEIIMRMSIEQRTEIAEYLEMKDFNRNDKAPKLETVEKEIQSHKFKTLTNEQARKLVLAQTIVTIL